MEIGKWRSETGARNSPLTTETPKIAGQRLGRASLTRGNVADSHTLGNNTPETRLPGWGTWIRTRINGVRVLAASSCLPRVKPGTVLLREYQGERLTVTVVPTGILWRETAYASLLQFSPPFGTARSGIALQSFDDLPCIVLIVSFTLRFCTS
jgi:hypothetical protein